MDKSKAAIVLSIVSIGISLGSIFFNNRTISTFIPDKKTTPIENTHYNLYVKPMSRQEVIEEINRASFCQNWVLPMMDKWKENKDKSVKEKLGPELWERCRDHLFQTFTITK